MKPGPILLVFITATAFALALANGACGGGDATCGVCDHAFTNAECADLAKAQGCSSGEAYDDNVCKPATRGCSFHGCPSGPIECTVPKTDGGADAAKD